MDHDELAFSPHWPDRPHGISPPFRQFGLYLGGVIVRATNFAKSLSGFARLIIVPVPPGGLSQRLVEA
jgi:hypothetical protein